MKITVVILTRNEEKSIERCLNSITFADELIIIDDYSIDNTVKIVEKLLKNKNYKIFQRKLNGDFANQRNFGMNKANNDWILFIDADEEVTSELKKSLTQIINKNHEEESIFIKRRDFFWNRELKYGEVRKVRKIGLVRLVKKGTGFWKGRVHEVFYTSSKVGYINGFLNHYPHQTIGEFINKVNNYSTLRAKELYLLNKKTNLFEIIFNPLGKFFFNYFINFGLLDGPAGFTYAFVMSFHSFLVRAKLFQLTKLNQ